MVDRERVVQALKDSLRNQHCGFIEGVGDVYAVSEETINDTLELLKEQEPVKAIKCSDDRRDELATWWYACGVCRNPIDYKSKFCSECGQAVKWDD